MPLKIGIEELFLDKELLVLIVGIALVLIIFTGALYFRSGLV